MDEVIYERAQAATEQATRAAIDETLHRPKESAHTNRQGQRICRDCEEPIDPRRLRAWPTAVRCTECQAIHDQYQRGAR